MECQILSNKHRNTADTASQASLPQVSKRMAANATAKGVS